MTEVSIEKTVDSDTGFDCLVINTGLSRIIRIIIDPGKKAWWLVVENIGPGGAQLSCRMDEQSGEALSQFLFEWVHSDFLEEEEEPEERRIDAAIEEIIKRQQQKQGDQQWWKS